MFPCEWSEPFFARPAAKKLGIDPAELLRMFNGRAPASKAVVARVVKALDTDVRFLDRLAEEIRNDLAAK
jgi:plasmid maintenance system antidote protein VapI